MSPTASTDPQARNSARSAPLPPAVPSSSKPPSTRPNQTRPLSRLVSDLSPAKPSLSKANSNHPPLKKAKPAQKLWECPVCTCHNPVTYLCCDACTTERPSDSIAFEVLEEEPTSRSASAATGVNNVNDNVKPTTSRDIMAAKAPSSRWACHRCSTIMESKWWTCSSCGTVKLSS